MSCYYFLVMLRPRQWIKNLMIFFPPVLSGSLLLSSTSFISGYISFVSFCLLSSALYICNDVSDKSKDLLHPVKCLRPIAAGLISERFALVVAAVLLALSFILSFISVFSVSYYLVLYGVITYLYTRWLKHYPVIDLLCISCGFLIRLNVGAVVFDVNISEWLFLSVFFLSLCLSAGKRLSEQILLGSEANEHRLSLKGYPKGGLDAILQVTAASVLVTYSMYTIAHPRLIYSVPICTYGLLRYILLVKNGHTGDPTESLLKDVQLFSVGLLWVFFVIWSIYL